MLNQWTKLVAYCDNGELRISNIMAENAIRRVTGAYAKNSSGVRETARILKVGYNTVLRA